MRLLSYAAIAAWCWCTVATTVVVAAFRTFPKPVRPLSCRVRVSGLTSTPSTKHSATIPIDSDFPGLLPIHSNPDIYIVRNFLEETACQDLMNRASAQTMKQSPTAYAGWTKDAKDLIELAAKGPVAWLALIGAWMQVLEQQQHQNSDVAVNYQLTLVLHALQNYAILFPLACCCVAAFLLLRANSLQSLRTSTSTTIAELRRTESDAGGDGAFQFVQRTVELFKGSDIEQLTLNSEKAARFEAPTVIRYEPGQVLAPHYDANRLADTEDANRGGQTLATLLVYLNDVARGGLTRFGKLSPTEASRSYNANNDHLTATLPCHPDSRDEVVDSKLTIRPRRGDALLFFPADAAGNFDERLEHEGCPAVDEKWIARIWVHAGHVPPPFGLSDEARATLDNQRNSLNDTYEK